LKAYPARLRSASPKMRQPAMRALFVVSAEAKTRPASSAHATLT
jgi:hypothetical protein